MSCDRCLRTLALLALLAGPSRADTGTAFVVGADGYLLTCHHVIAEATQVTVTIGEERHAAQVLAADAEQDLAVLKIDVTGLTALPLGNSNELETGETVRTFGYPLIGQLGTSLKVTTGAVSGIASRGARRLIQVDAPINPGGSGGPLVNAEGEVVGVVSAKLPGEQASNVGFVIPINYAKPLLRDEGVEPLVLDQPTVVEGPELVRRIGPSVLLVNTVKAAVQTAPSAEQRATLRGHRGGIEQAVWSPDGSLIATASHDHTCRLWDAISGELRGVLQGHRGCVHAVCFSADSKLIATGGPDLTVRLWNVEARETVQVLEGHAASVERIAFAPNGRLVATATGAKEDPIVRVYDVRTGQLLRALEGHSDRVAAISFSNDSATLLSAGADGTARLWDLSALTGE